MAGIKQPTVQQMDQLIKDVRVTSRRSDFPDIRQAAAELLPTAERLRDQLDSYVRLVR